MATLYERITGVGLSDAESGDKIGIHAFIAAVFCAFRGVLTPGQVSAMFSFTTDQQSDAQTFASYINASPDKELFVRVFKDCAYLAEGGYAYMTQQDFVQALQAEIVRQGGTVP